MSKAMAQVTVVIPARYGSSRFPGKPLASLAGKPLIQHVYDCVRTVPSIARVVVATDDARIADTVSRFGGTVVMTTSAFRTGTDRVAAVAEGLPGDVFINLQGDEILVDRRVLEDLVTPFLASEAGMGTLKRSLNSWDEVRDPGVVKVVTDHRGQALYFSRAPIPVVRDGPLGPLPEHLYAMHLGIYAFRREVLRQFAALPTGRLEDAEKLEQLRALEHGIPIAVWETTHASLRVDTPEDLSRAATQLESQMRVYSHVEGRA